MSVILGIDVGGSTTKIVGLRGKEPAGMLQVRAGDQITSLYGAVGNLLRSSGIALSEVSAIALTGAGASFIDEQIYGIATHKVPEFTAIGKGALLLSGLSEALVVSMGTGTAFVRACSGSIERIGGSGVGGGTILGLCSHILGKGDINSILALAQDGNLGNVDLLVKDITCGDIPLLGSHLTAANFGKIKSTASDSDFALGVINMVFQTVIMLAVFAMRNDPIRDVLLTGTLATFPQISPMLPRFEQLTDLKFTVPPDAVFATALGAAHIFD